MAKRAKGAISTTPRADAGGAGAVGGFSYQERVTAWVAVQILAEAHSSLPWDLPTQIRTELISLETPHAVDDIVCTTSEGGVVFQQAKRNLTLSNEFYSALRQFIGQFLAKPGSQKTDGLQRCLDKAKDRLCLTVNTGASSSVKETLISILRRAEPTPATLMALARNKIETNVLKSIADKIKAFWKQVTAAAPSDQEIISFLQLVRVIVLDVEPAQSGELNALNQLRSSVLMEPDEAPAAWSTLLNLCQRCTAERRSLDLPRLQRALIDEGFRLKGRPSYAEDLRRLLESSRRNRDKLRTYSSIQLNPPVAIRRDCHSAISQRVKEGNLLVLGDPGSGKTGALYQFIVEEEAAGRDLLVLSVEHLSSQSLGALRTELGLDHELVDVLDNYHGSEPAYFILDGLDSARDTSIGKMLKALIEEVSQLARWRIVATIRRYDLRYSTLASCFTSQNRLSSDLPHINPEFLGYRHVSVGRFSLLEFEQLASTATVLYQLVVEATPELRMLLEIPFNLNLAAALMTDGLSYEQIAQLKTQQALLDRYWQSRVLSADCGDQSEFLLRKTCQSMLANRRLSINREELQGLNAPFILTELLSRNLLCECQANGNARPDREILAFSHNLLFDYAVARLILRTSTLPITLKERTDFAFIARPSLEFHFAHLWYLSSDRAAFWEVVFAVIADPEIPEIAKLVGPAVAAKLTREESDLTSLVQASTSKESVAALKHLALSLREHPPENLIGARAAPWSLILETLSSTLSQDTAWPVQILLFALSDAKATPTDRQRKSLGLAARRFIEFVWREDIEYPAMRFFIDVMVDAYETAPEATFDIISQMITPEALVARGYIQIPALADKIGSLIHAAPGIASLVYGAAFLYEEESRESTVMVPSKVLPLTSNRRQDFQMSRYTLAEAFPDFLVQRPDLATLVLSRVLIHHFTDRRFKAPEDFVCGGRNARIQTDYSRAALMNSNRSKEPIQMLLSFREYLAKQGSDSAIFQLVFRTIVDHCEPASLWRELIANGASNPTVAGRMLFPLLLALPVLSSDDTTFAAGDLIQALDPYLSDEEISRIESAILSLPGTSELARRNQGRLLSRLKLERIRSETAKKLRSDYEAALGAARRGSSTENDAESKSEDVLYQPEKTFEEPPLDYHPLKVLSLPIEEFVNKFTDEATIPPLEIDQIIPRLAALLERLQGVEDPPDSLDSDLAWGYLAWACERIAQSGNFASQADFIRETLLLCSHRRATDGQLRDFRHPAWGMPCTPVSAAEGLMILAASEVFSTDGVLEAIRRLSRDADPAVRFQIFGHLANLADTHSAMMWDIAHHAASNEANPSLGKALLRSLFPLAIEFPGRVVPLIQLVRSRRTPGDRSPLTEECIWLLLRAHFSNDEQATKIVGEIVDAPASNWEEAITLAGCMRDGMSAGLHMDNLELGKLGRDSFNFVDRLLTATSKILERHDLLAAPAESNMDEIKSCNLVFDAVATQLYFASGAYQPGANPSGPPLDQLRGFYKLARETFKLLSNVGFPQVAHHTLQVLELFIDIEPKAIFELVGRSVMASEPFHLLQDPLVEKTLLQIVRRYLADYRGILQQDPGCRKVLVKILDIFVGAGSREAMKLVYELDIFR